LGHFKIKAKQKLSNMKIGDRLEESDFTSITPDTGEFVQMSYVEDEKEQRTYEVKPGTWTMQKTVHGLKLEPTSFVSDSILETFVNTKELTTKIDCFFRNLHVYKEHGIEIPKRAALLYGPAGTGKTTNIISVCNNYTKDGNTAIVIWSTDKHDAHEVKDFIKTFEYKGVNKLILVAEDIGGVEMDQVRMKSMSSLLSLLDNKEKTFTLPVFIIATTNFPENFMGNLTNRPGRFDDKIECPYPNGAQRKELLKFFGKGKISEDILEKISYKKYDNAFSAAHLQEVVIRSAIYELEMSKVIDQIAKDIKDFNNAFISNKQKLGIIDEGNFPD
jgi:SpoVK/Ycf46/Vps4 family AAA+-type ATPase